MSADAGPGEHMTDQTQLIAEARRLSEEYKARTANGWLSKYDEGLAYKMASKVPALIAALEQAKADTLREDELRRKVETVEKLTSHIRERRRRNHGYSDEYEFALKYGQLRHELKCEDCQGGDCYHCAFGNPSYPRCCCPVRLDLVLGTHEQGPQA